MNQFVLFDLKSSKRLLTVNVAHTVLATRGFGHSAVAAWNNLPENIRSSADIDFFKRSIKTLLFNTAFATCSIGQSVSTNSFHAT